MRAACERNKSCLSPAYLRYQCTDSKKVVADGPDGPARTPGTEARVTSRLADRITCGPRRLFVSLQLCTRTSKNTHTNCATSVRFLDTFLRLAYFESLKSLQRLSRRRGKVTHRRTKAAAAVHLLFMAAATEPCLTFPHSQSRSCSVGVSSPSLVAGCPQLEGKARSRAVASVHALHTSALVDDA